MSKKKANILYVFADQWRRQAVGFMGEDQVITPKMDEFADDGLVFENAISCCPLCSPQRASLLTGRYPIQTGVFTNCKTGEDLRLGDDEVCLSDVLKEENYNTGYIGKWHLDEPDLNKSDNPESGASGWDAYTPPGPRRHGFDFWYSYGASNNHLSQHYWMDSPEKITTDKWSPEHETDVAIDFIKRNKDSENPFALFMSWNPPHSPYDKVPQKYKDMYKDKDIKFRENVKIDDIGNHTYENWDGGKEELEQATKDYFAAVTGLDDNFARLLKALEDYGLKDDTIIVLTSDHGDLMGSHSMMAKHVWYEESIGVPFIMRWGDKIKKGRENKVINSVDIMPTLLGLIDVDIPNTVEGTDLSANLKETADVEAPPAFIHAYPGRNVFLDSFREHDIDPLTRGWRGLRTEDYTYVVHRGYMPDEDIEERYLYNLKEDPYQLNPIVLKDPEENKIAKDLHKQLKERLEKVGDPFEL